MGDYYHTDMERSAEMTGDMRFSFGIRDGIREYAPEDGDHTKGLIIYPGGKVDFTAYGPIAACAERGYLCLLVRMPGNLAVLDMDAPRT